MCRCNESRRNAVNPQPAMQIVFGEKGLEKLQGKEDAIGYVTRYRYPFSIRNTMFVDVRDAVYLLGESYQYAS